MKRFISIMLALAMTIVLAACGQQPQTDNNLALPEVSPNTTYSGTVNAISNDSITVSTADGDITIALTESTVITGGFAPNGAGEMPIGEINDSMRNQPDNDEQPPEKPDGDFDNQPERQGTPPELPQGEQPGEPYGDMPERADEERGMPELGVDSPMLTASNITIGTDVVVETDENCNAAFITLSADDMGAMPNRKENPSDMQHGVDSYTAATEFVADVIETNGNYISNGKDENAVRVYENADVTLEAATITRASDNSTGGDTSSFYGVGAAALVTDGSLTIIDSAISTDAAGGAGVFAYGNGTARVINTTIDTIKDASGGVHVAGGGKLYAWDLTVETNGESSAAIRSDRGSGTMVINGGSYTSNGVGSPAIYSAADITVNNAELVSNASEAICIEGLNTIRLFNCDLSGNMQDLSQNDCTWNVILYQSMSGDSEIGNSTFEMVGGSLQAGNGGMFYTTNTESTFILSGVDISYGEDSEFFLKCTGNANQRGWGISGNNGADCHFTGVEQAMQGDVIWDSISCLDYYIMSNSTFTGAVIKDETNAGSAGNGYCSVYVDADSTWTVTADSLVSNLYCEGSIVDVDGNAVSIVGLDGTVYVEGASPIVVTVETYSNTTDLTGASALDSWEDFAVDKPA